MNNSDDKGFFLPDLRQPQSILFLVLISELLVFVVVLFSTDLAAFNWIELGLASLFVQWLVLSSAGVLSYLRPWLIRLPVLRATVIAYVTILLLTLLFSVLAEFVLAGVAVPDDFSSSRIARNLIISVIMTGIAFRYLFLTNELRIQQQAELTSRIQALQSRIRPHFLFNSMNIIASLISVDPDVAEEVVEDLSVLFRASLDEATSEPVKLAEELELCRKYVHIESLRLDERLSVAWSIDVDADNVRIPLLTLQPLLENAIYHGIQPRIDGGEVRVEITQKSEQLHLSITNPLAPEGYSHESGNQMALENIRNRMTAIYGAEAALKAGESGGSFVTTLTFPCKYE